MTNASTSSPHTSGSSTRFTIGVLSLVVLILIAYFLPSIFQGMLWIFLALICVFGWLLIDAVIFGATSHLFQRFAFPVQLGLMLLLVLAAIALLWFGHAK